MMQGMEVLIEGVKQVAAVQLAAQRAARLGYLATMHGLEGWFVQFPPSSHSRRFARCRLTC
jgi:hypothetical protein